MDGLKLPILKGSNKGQLAKENDESCDLSAIMDKISDVLTHIVIDILSLLLLYIAILIF